MLRSWANLNWRMCSQKQPTLVHRPQVTASEVVGLEGVDIVEVVELVAAIRPSWIPSTRKGMTRVQKSHGLALIGYCLTTMAGHRDAHLMLVLGHPTPPVMRTLFQPRLRTVVLARTMRTLPVCRPQFSGGCIFVSTPSMPIPPLVHVEPTMSTSSPTPHEEAVQIEQIPAEDIEPVVGLRRSRRPPAHAPDCGTSDGMYLVYTSHLLELLILCI